MSIVGGLGRSRLWWTLAIEEIRSTYTRSFLGIGWFCLSFAAFLLVKFLIFGQMSQEGGGDYAVYLTLGFFAWTFISSSMMDGCDSFVRARNWIQGVAVPLSVFAYKVVARNSLLSLINLVVVFGVFLWVRPQLTWMALWSVAFFGLLIINAIWVSLLFGVIGARFRDFKHLINTLIRMLLFLTPIFWTPEDIGPLWEYLVYNPLAHFLILIREPIMESTIPMQSVYVALGVTGFGWVLAVGAYLYASKRIVFWL